jgi:hypothetical protein
MDKELYEALDRAFTKEHLHFYKDFGWMDQTMTFDLWSLESFIGKNIEDIPRALLKEDQGLRCFGDMKWPFLKHILNGILISGGKL